MFTVCRTPINQVNAKQAIGLTTGADGEVMPVLKAVDVIHT